MRWIMLVLSGVALQAHGDWLSLCHGLPAQILQQQDDTRIAHYLAPDESVTVLRLTKDQAEGPCDQLKLSLNAQDVVWAGFTTKMGKDTASVALQGNERDQRFRVSEVILPEPNGTSSKDTDKPPVFGRQIRSQAPTRSAWLWSPALWIETPDRIFDIQTKFGINRIYISVPVAQGKVRHPDELRQFLQNAHARGLQVWVVLGDPQALLSEGAEQFRSASAAYASFNHDIPGAERLDGLQLDIEAYLLPGYWQDAAAWLSKYSLIVTSIHKAAAGLPLDIVLPFWFTPGTSPVDSMLDNVKDSIDRVTVMDYRTDQTQIKLIATRFLAWGKRNGKSVDIALETLPMEQEDRRHYRAATAGELWRLQLGGNTVLLLVNEARQPDPGITSYRYTHNRTIDGTDISFYKDKERFQALLAPLEKELSAWPSFSGIAIHGLDHW